MSSSTNEQVEDRCLDGEAWADELDLWRPKNADSSRVAEAAALAAMLRALVKSIRLSLLAEGDPRDRGYLVEELDATIEMSRAFALETGTPVRRRSHSMVAPPPALVRDEGARDRSPPEDGEEQPPPTIRPFDHATAPPPPGLDPNELFERAPSSDEIGKIPLAKRWKLRN